jgi:hypothetical protein
VLVESAHPDGVLGHVTGSVDPVRAALCAQSL